MSEWNIPGKRNRTEVVIHTLKSPLDSKAIRNYLKKIKKFFPQLKKIYLSIAVVSDFDIERLNVEFTQRETATDVLSFLYKAPFPLGEIIISGEQSYKNARRYRTTPEKEFLRYLIHGILHLLGYNDLRPEEKKLMQYIQKKVLKEITK